MDFLRLLRQRRVAERKEHGAKRKDGDLSSCLSLLSPLVTGPSSHSARPVQHRLRYGETDLFRRLKIDHQLKGVKLRAPGTAIVSFR